MSPTFHGDVGVRAPALDSGKVKSGKKVNVGNTLKGWPRSIRPTPNSRLRVLARQRSKCQIG